MPSLVNDVRQLFSETILQRYERLAEAGINFDFNHGEIYLSTFAEAMNIVDNGEHKNFDSDLLAHAQVFEQFIAHPVDSIDRVTAGLISASLYWLAGYSANAYVISKEIFKIQETWLEPKAELLKILSRRNLGEADLGNEIDSLLAEFILTGNEEKIGEAINRAQELRNSYLQAGIADDFVLSHLLAKILENLRLRSFWRSVREHSSAPLELWQNYVRYQINSGSPIVDLWPSQRTAISKGLIDSVSSVVIRMPTSSGKTKMTELAFINDLYTNTEKRCLYLAPFRALVSEVENSIGHTLSQIGFTVASLYGGSEANELEVQLTNIASVIIATPEKMAAVLKLSGGSLKDFDTIVLDEGHLLDSTERGTTYELQLATLRPQLAEHNRAIFLSAVLPNSSELAYWLKGTADVLAEEDWQPTNMRVGVVTWPNRAQVQLDYLSQKGQPLTDNFFVPRLLEEDRWSELNTETGRQNRRAFPDRNDKGSIASALAFQAAKFGTVIIYASQPRWANSTAETILERLSLQRPISTNLINDSNRERIEQLAAYLQNTLGDESILPRTVSHGFALHHGGIPQGIRLILEEEFRNQTLKLLIATNTIAQGVNFPVRTVIVHSMPAFDSPIRDFWNLAGRAGRALKETEGEVIVVGTGKMRRGTILRFLNEQNRESAESRILYLVRRLLDIYPSVSNETIESLIATHERGTQFAKIVHSIDTFLLEIMAEESAVDTADSNFETLVENLFATYQATALDAQQDTQLRDGVNNLMRERRVYVLSRVPDGSLRKRYAQSGLSIESSISLDEVSEEMQVFFENNPSFSQEAFNGIVDYVHRARELEDYDVQLIKTLGYIWILTGRYDTIYEAGRASFDNFDDAVKYVETILCYQVPWILSGFVRLLNQIGDLPDWFTLMPDFLRYGVNEQVLVWVLSLGFTDRRFAEWVLEIYRVQNGTYPSNFREWLQWMLVNRQSISEQIDQTWPHYFRILFEKISDRYQRISDVLNQN
jgi:superfamily II DNA/RNA helicase